MARTDAQHVVLELIRSAGGAWDGRAKLSKAFNFAHLYYAAASPGILTDWPLIRTPQGPGIHNDSVLLQGLVKNGYLTIETIREGPYPDSRYRLTSKVPAEPSLPDDATAAVKAAVDFVTPRTASELSQLTQERSRSWREARESDTLDIYIDLLSDEEYEAGQEEVAELDQQLTAVLLDQQIARAVGEKSV